MNSFVCQQVENCTQSHNLLGRDAAEIILTFKNMVHESYSIEYSQISIIDCGQLITFGQRRS